MKNRAFTLIELLVVVLIIGILAAIAVPQYQIAVAKSRIAGYFPFIKSLAEAEEVYYLQNDKYSLSLKELDVSIPESCSFFSPQTYYYDHVIYCNDDIMIDNQKDGSKASGRLTLRYCPGFANQLYECSATNPFLQINFFLNKHATSPNEIHCKGWVDQGKAICQKFSGQMIIDD